MANQNTANCGLVVGTIFILSGIVLATVSIATDEWVELPSGKQGLWRTCPNQGSCHSIDGSDSDLDAVCGTMVVGDICGGFGLATAITLLACLAFREVNGRWVITIIFIAVFSFLAFVFTLVGVCVYDGEIYEDYNDADHGYSFWLAVAAILLFAIATFFFSISAFVSEISYRKRKRREEKQKMVEREKQSMQPYYNGAVVPYEYSKRPVVYDRYYDDRKAYDGYQVRQNRRAVDYPVAAVPVYPFYRDYYSQDGLNVYNYGEPAIINPSAGRFHDRPRIHRPRGHHTQPNDSSRRGARDHYGYPMNYMH